ncbi:PGAP1-like protein-domain-containing protein [Dipodascopsis uninucleata]
MAKVESIEATVSEGKPIGRRSPVTKQPYKKLLAQYSSKRTFAIVFFSFLIFLGILFSFFFRQQESRGCRTPYMSPSYARIKSFDTSHTRFATKYALYLYREQGLDTTIEPRGVPILFIPGNAGSYKQARSIAAEAAKQYYGAINSKGSYGDAGSLNLDFFTADFNEDFTAFHGRTLLDQAEYLNDAIPFILSLYSRPADSEFSNPRSVILLGHSMGGIVARTMLTLPSYRPDSVNTIITLSAPHAHPPASFDWDIVSIYQKINQYWRESYSDSLIGRNPLASVSVISIAGGKLDLIVPSDYTSVSSLMPSSNGFTVFTSTMPNVWTSTDHLSIVWCDQFRKVVTKALLDIVDARDPTQTKFLNMRMQIFRNIFLTGLEEPSRRTIPYSLVHDTLLKIQDGSGVFIEEGKRLVLRSLGTYRKPKVYMLPIPKSSAKKDFFSILTDQKLEIDGQDHRIDVLLCEQTTENLDSRKESFSTIIDLSKGEQSQNFLCTNSADDKLILPASTHQSKYPHDGEVFSYIQYRLNEISRYDFLAVVDSHSYAAPGFFMAELVNNMSYKFPLKLDSSAFLHNGVELKLPAERPGFVELSVDKVFSSLVSYRLKVQPQTCRAAPLFYPLVRQFVEDPNESKFFSNAKEVDINYHGSSPYVPVLSRPGSPNKLRFQLWMDPTCDEPESIFLKIDLLGSLGNIVMRYRTAVAALPLAVVAVVLLIQFNIYDSEGIFVSFGTGLEIFIGRVLPIMSLVSSLYIIASSYLVPLSNLPFIDPEDQLVDSDVTKSTFHRKMNNNGMFLGLNEPYLFLLGPLFLALSCGMCAIVYYAAILVFFILSRAFLILKSLYTSRPSMMQSTMNRMSVTILWILTKAVSSAHYFKLLLDRADRRLLTTFVLLVSVLAFVPYQFAFIVGFIVLCNTCFKVVHGQNEQLVQAGFFTPNFCNFSFSMLMLLIWILPINIPLLIVWIHNLSVHWYTPFSSHHNILSVMPIILLVERMTSGRMIPRMTGRSQIITKILLLYIIIYACLHGVLNAYWLHQLVNGFSAWLFLIYV